MSNEKKKKQDKPTKYEHFVPKCYLKQFTIDERRLYEFDTSSGIQIHNPVSIRSICADDNLYEFRDENGEFMYSNLMEDILHDLEGEFTTAIKSINRKAFIKGNLKTGCFLTPEEKDTLVLYMAVQRMRMPSLISEVEAELRKKYEDILYDSTIRNVAIISCLPISVDKKSALRKCISELREMTYSIGVAYRDCIITSDNPVSFLYDDNYDKLEEVIFPLSSRAVLYMQPRSQTKPGRRNILFELTQDSIDNINQVTMELCSRWIYSKQPLSQNQIEWLNSNKNKVGK